MAFLNAYEMSTAPLAKLKQEYEVTSGPILAINIFIWVNLSNVEPVHVVDILRLELQINFQLLDQLDFSFGWTYLMQRRDLMPSNLIPWHFVIR